MRASVADPNLLFFVLARQLGFISREDLEESVQHWRDEAVRSPGRRLVDQQVLQREEFELLNKLKNRLLCKYHHDPARCLARIAHASSAVADELRELNIATPEDPVPYHAPPDPTAQLRVSYNIEREDGAHRSTWHPSEVTIGRGGLADGIDSPALTAPSHTRSWQRPVRTSQHSSLETDDVLARSLIGRSHGTRNGFANAHRSERVARVVLIGLVLLLITLTSVITHAWTVARKDQQLAVANSRANEVNAELKKVTSQAEFSQDEHEAVLQFVRQHVLSASRPFFFEGGLGLDITVKDAIDAAEQQITQTCTDQPLLEAAIRSLWGDTFQSLGELQLATAQHEQVCKLREAELGADHPSTLAARDRLGMTYLARRDSRRGLPILEDTFQRRQETLGPNHLDTIRSMNHLALAYANRKRVSKAVEFYEDALQLSTQSLGADHRETLSTMFQAASARLRTDKPQEALPMIEDLVARSRQAFDKSDQEFATLLSNVGRVLLDHKQYAAAESYWRECVSMREASEAKRWELFDAQAKLGIAIAAQGGELFATDPDAARLKFEEAELLLKAGGSGLLRRAGVIPVPERTSVLVALNGLVSLYTAWGKPEEATHWQQLLIQVRAGNRGVRFI